MDILEERELLKAICKMDDDLVDCEDLCVNEKWILMGARAAQAKAQAVPEGFVLMPIKPTETMVMAVVKEHEGDAFLPYSLYDAYVKQAMIEAQELAND